MVPSRYPSAMIDLAFVTPSSLHAADLAVALRTMSPLVDEVVLFDVYRGPALPAGTRSLAYNVRLSSDERTLSDDEIATIRTELIETAQSRGATLR